MAKNYHSIYGALAANVLIGIIKFVASSITHSSSMFSEGIHSLVDSVNQLLLLYGLKRSKKPADRIRPFGYGKELYFWSFVVSILIFGLGGGISIYQGFQHMFHPIPLENPGWNYAVLGFSALFEGGSLWIAIREFDKVRNGLSWWKAILKSKDPSTFLVLFEDGASVLGLFIVFVLMALRNTFHLEYLDGLASVLVGLLLVSSSAILAHESQSLLMGEGVGPDTQRKLKGLIEKDPDVLKVLNSHSIFQSPDEVLLILTITFRPHLKTEGLTNAIERITKEIQKEFKLIRYVMIQPQSLPPLKRKNKE
jgi:cation diffusion facilitator family transporter